MRAGTLHVRRQPASSLDGRAQAHLTRQITRPRLSTQPPRYRFFLNPYPDVRFTKCPQCGDKTRARKLPLVIHIDPLHLMTLNKTCRYCPRCDLLIAHQDELEAFLTSYFHRHDPEVIGNEYLVMGTVERADWQRGASEAVTPQEMLERLYPFVEQVRFEPASPVA